MRVVLLVTEYISEKKFAGGLANYTYRIAQGLKDLGHEPIVVVSAAEYKTLWHNGIQVRRVRAYLPQWIRVPKKMMGIPIKLPFRAVRKLRNLYNKRPNAPAQQAVINELHMPASNQLNTAMYLLGLGFGIRKALEEIHKESPVDVAHYTHLSGISTFRVSKIPSVVRLSSHRDLWKPHNCQFAGPMQRRLEDIGVKRADRVVCPSHWVADYVTQKLDVPIQVVESPFVPPPDPEDTTVFEEMIGPQTTYGLYFGSLAEWKGIFVLAEALEPFLQQHPDYTFVFVGRTLSEKEGLPAPAYIKKRLSAYSDRIKILGALRHPKLFPIIRGAQFVALPSLADNFPNACLESMWLERVTIGTRGRSFDQLIEHEKNGFLCEPGDVESLRRALEKAAELPAEQRTKMGAAAKQRIQQLTPEKVVSELLKVYEQAIADKK
ncbi:MAG: glycosyltransferase family 4 protein [Cyanobacteria bacterium J06576_12]